MPSEPTLLESYTQDIAGLVESFSEKDPAGKQSLIQLLTSDSQAFCSAAVRVLSNGKVSQGSRFLVFLLTKEKLLTSALLDPNASSIRDAAAAAKTIEELGTRLQPAFEVALSKALRPADSATGSTRTLRILELLENIGAQSCWPSFQSELMSHADKTVRSKAALLIGRNTRNTAWIGRRLLDRDGRVQANAVEALWNLSADVARPMLTTALRSSHNRVIANAALGLYRICDLKAVRVLLDMAQHTNPVFRLSALWAMGETEDQRFLHFLMEQFKSTQGKMKLAVTRALSRIRRHEKLIAEKGTVAIHLFDASIQQDGRRRLAFALSHPGTTGFPGMKPTEFAVWEGGHLIEEYEVKLPSNPAVQVVGIVAPRFLSTADPYGDAVTASLTRCLKVKRSDDLWRLDRYDTETAAPAPGVTVERSSFPYDDSLLTQELKVRQSFISAADLLDKAISMPVAREKSASDALQAIKRQLDAMDKSSGKRHLFVFAHETSMDLLDDPENIKVLKKLVETKSFALHGICAGSSERCAGFRDLCSSAPEGTFIESSVDKIADELEELYRHLLNRFEINYPPPAGADPAPVSLQISGQYGSGNAEISLAARP
jgi:HEAT repeat protein